MRRSASVTDNSRGSALTQATDRNGAGREKRLGSGKPSANDTDPIDPQRPGLWRLERGRQGALMLLALLASLWLAPAQAPVALCLAAFSLASLLWLG